MTRVKDSWQSPQLRSLWKGCEVISARNHKSNFTQPVETKTLSNFSLSNWTFNRDYTGKNQWDAGCSGAGHDLWHSWHTCDWTRPEQDWCPRCYAGEWNCGSFNFAFLQPVGYETCPLAGITENQHVQVTERIEEAILIFFPVLVYCHVGTGAVHEYKWQLSV